MNVTKKEILANQIYGEDEAREILDFLVSVAPDKHEFRTEKTFLNFIARKLEPMLKRKARSSEKNSDFWKSRAMSMDIQNRINKKKNVLWCIRLLEGKAGAPD